MAPSRNLPLPSAPVRQKTGRLLATLALAVLWLSAAGCEDVGYGNSPYYGGASSSGTRTIPPAPQTTPATPAAKIVAPAPSSRIASKTVPSSRSATTQSKPAARGGGGLEDLIRDIEQSDREKARQLQKEERRKREMWLAAHDADLSGVRTRLSAMQISLLSLSDARSRESVSKAIAETEKEIDAVRKKYGDGKVGFTDASRLRSAVENRHESLLSTCPEYRQLMEN